MNSPGKWTEVRSPETIRSSSSYKSNRTKIRSTIDEYVNKIRFDPYRSTRPKLLDELMVVVEQARKLRAPTVKGEKDREDLEEYRKAFQIYIDNSHIYRDVLTEVKESYESSLRVQLEKIASYSCLQANYDKVEQEFTLKMQLMEIESTEKYEILKSMHTNLALDLSCKEKALAALSLSHNALVIENDKNNSLVNDLKKNVMTLSKAIANQEVREANEKQQINTLSVELERTNVSMAHTFEEMQQLLLKIQDLEEYQSTLLSPEEVVVFNDRIKLVEMENQECTRSNRELLFRYTVLKGVISKALLAFRAAISKERREDRRQRRREVLAELYSEAVERSTMISSHELYDIFIEQGIPVPANLAIEGQSPEENTDEAVVVSSEQAGNDDAEALREAISLQTSRQDAIYDSLQLQVTALFGHGDDPRHIIELLVEKISFLTREINRFHISVNEESLNELEVNEKSEGVTGDVVASPWSHYKGGAQAFGDTRYPTYLYVAGCIRNAHVGRLECRLEIQQIFKYKEQLDAEEDARRVNEMLIRLEWEQEDNTEEALEHQQAARRAVLEQELLAMPYESFHDFFERYLLSKFPGGLQDGFEFAVNLIATSLKNLDDSMCKLFVTILRNELSFETRLDQIERLHSIKLACIKRDECGAETPSGWIRIEDFLETVKEQCPNKSSVAAIKLEKYVFLAPRRKSILDESTSEVLRQVINYEDLLHMSDKSSASNVYSENKFCELFNVQHIDECIVFANKLEAAITRRCIEKLVPPPDSDSNGQYVYVHNIREAIESADSNKRRDDVNIYLARGAGLLIEEILLHEGNKVPIELFAFKKRLRQGLLVESNFGSNAAQGRGHQGSRTQGKASSSILASSASLAIASASRSKLHASNSKIPDLSSGSKTNILK